MTKHIPDAEWSAELHAFTQRNAGRLTIIEENDPELGVQREEQGIELRGVAFDPHDRSVAIMLGELEGTERHITHVVHDVVAIDVLTTEQDRDVALRLARGDGQTILRFSPT